jgi:hypothetical protein
MNNIPKEIYLNLSEIEPNEDFLIEEPYITWSKEKVNDNDIKYVLSDK